MQLLGFWPPALGEMPGTMQECNMSVQPNLLDESIVEWVSL